MPMKSFNDISVALPLPLMLLEPGAMPPQILENQLTLSQTGMADYVHHIPTCPFRFSDLPTALLST